MLKNVTVQQTATSRKGGIMKNKGNDGSGNIPERDLWQTDQKLFDLLNKQYHFTFDCCATIDNTKCLKFSSNFLSVSANDLRNEICWMNPPFSKARAMFEHFFKVVKKGVAIYRIDNPETKIWQEVIFPYASWIFFPKGRINYTSFDINLQNSKGSRFPSALIGLNVEPILFLKGHTLILNEKGC